MPSVQICMDGFHSFCSQTSLKVNFFCVCVIIIVWWGVLAPNYLLSFSQVCCQSYYMFVTYIRVVFQPHSWGGVLFALHPKTIFWGKSFVPYQYSKIVFTLFPISLVILAPFWAKICDVFIVPSATTGSSCTVAVRNVLFTF